MEYSKISIVKSVCLSRERSHTFYLGVWNSLGRLDKLDKNCNNIQFYIHVCFFCRFCDNKHYCYKRIYF